MDITCEWTVTPEDWNAGIVTGNGTNDSTDVNGGVCDRVKMFAKGIRIVANVTVSNYNVPSKFGNEHDDDFTWDVGLVQILESSTMKAVYGTDDKWGRGRLVYEWKQNTLPCYDCTTADFPFYDNQCHAQVAGDGQHQFTLSDVPSLAVNLYTQSWFPGYQAPPQPLAYALKDNKFNVYCVLRAKYKTGAHVGNVAKHRLEKHCMWKTRMAREPNANWAGANRFTTAGYSELDYSFTSSWIYKVLTIPYFALPDYSAGIANDSQNNQGREQYHCLPFAYAWK
jgi:hypothetical protein